ncbi:TonB-dependent receptor domain-containing protein [Serratia marcescens]|uniref:TonB-dependent receptor domain-containing protein n=1 Tax=Serratia marcescens TaxID=615 RepID=UPI000F8030E4|nr:TonB-dependent receptor [Serratia marcescens]RTF04881.1 TonB-dependent receptor [Serratia marcescens]
MKIKMIASLIGAGLALYGPAAAAQEQAENNKGSVAFSPLNVSAADGGKSSEKEALAKPGAFSSRDENKNLESVDSILRSMPGTYTQIDPSQGAVSVNIRGLSGFGRVNTMVDGITQNYYGTSTSGVISHGSTNNQAGVLIDPNFIVGVDVARGENSGGSGVNALAGSANFRTIGVDDVIFSGNPFGVRTKFSVGSNGIGRSGMIAVAGKGQAFTDTGSIGAMAAVSGSSIYSNFNNGDGISSEDFGYDEFMKQNPKSQLFKLDIKPNEFNSIEFSARNYQNRFSRRDIDSHDLYLKYHYAPFSELVDLNFTVSTSKGNQKYDGGSLFTFFNTNAKNRSDALDINNPSRFSLLDTDVAFSYGGKLMRNQYRKHVESAIENAQTAQEAIENNTFAPSGEQRIGSLYTGLQLNRDIYQLDLNLNYTSNKLTGYKPECDYRVECFPQGAANINLKEQGFNPSVMLSAQVTPWLQPFVSYSKSMRAPNIQEVFYSNSGGASMNPFLKGERAETWQAGFNANGHDLLVKEDSLRLKVVGYTSKVRNYIFSESYMVCRNGRKCSYRENLENDWADASEDYSDNMYIYVNSLTPVRMHGVEVEANYDAGRAFARVSFSKQHTEQPTSIASTYFGAGDINELPDMYFTLDTGVRFLDESLTVGSIVKYTGKTRRLSPDYEQSEVTGEILKQEMPNIPTIIDLYSTYQINRNVMLKFSVQNVMNKSYSEALNKLNMLPIQGDDATAANTARGRTYIFGGEVRF